MKKMFIIIIACLFCFVSQNIFAKEEKYVGKYSSLVKAKGRIMKHFDVNTDGYLNRYENALYKTHKLFGYPLAKTKSQKEHDYNHDLMLQPYEMQMYLKDKGKGT